MKNRSFTLDAPGGAARVRRRALAGGAVLAVLLALAGLAAFLTRTDRTAKPAQPHGASAQARPPAAVPASLPTPARDGLPVPPDTNDPLVYAKVAAVALWSYDTRAYTQPQLVAALNGWLTSESTYADASSVDALVPKAQVWQGMAQQGQFATATAATAAFPASFSQAMAADPGAITTAYVYAVTVTGSQSIGWSGAARGGVQGMSMTLAVQCRPDRPCALAGVLPATAP